jgi:hypothetical protein
MVKPVVDFIKTANFRSLQKACFLVGSLVTVAALAVVFFVSFADRKEPWIYAGLLALAAVCFVVGFGAIPYFIRPNKADVQENLDQAIEMRRKAPNWQMSAGAHLGVRLYGLPNFWIGFLTLTFMWGLGALFIYITFIAQPGRTLYSDDFSDPGSGWMRYTSDAVTLDYSEGGYSFRINAPENWYLLQTSGAPLNNVRVEADAKLVTGGPGTVFGLVCRANSDQLYYLGWVNSNGEYGFEQRLADGGWRHIINGSASFPEGNDLVRLRLDCDGSNLELALNGVTIAAAVDKELTSGNVGFGAGTASGSAEGAEVFFDNFALIDLGGNEDALGAKPSFWQRLWARLIAFLAVIAVTSVLRLALGQIKRA